MNTPDYTRSVGQSHYGKPQTTLTVWNTSEHTHSVEYSQCGTSQSMEHQRSHAQCGTLTVWNVESSVRIHLVGGGWWVVRGGVCQPASQPASQGMPIRPPAPPLSCVGESTFSSAELLTHSLTTPTPFHFPPPTRTSCETHSYNAECTPTSF